MDIASTTVPDSTQVNADDLIASAVTVTIESVSKGSAEQPVDIHLAEFPGRAYRPSKSMRRVLVAAWGPEAANYTGRRLTIYRDPEVTFGRDKVGGIKISHLSHIDKRLSIALTVSRGKRSPHVVEPLTESPATTEPTSEQVAACNDLDTLGRMWQASGAERRADIEAKVFILKEAAGDE